MKSLFTNLGLPVLKTERLLLRPFEKTDFPKLRELDEDPEVIRYLGHGGPRSLSETEENLKKILRDYQMYGIGLYAAELLDSGEFVGRTGVIPWTIDGDLYWEVGYTVLKKHWGQGFATEAARFLTSWGRSKVPAEYLVSFIHPENTASKRVAGKVGMAFWKQKVLHNRTFDVFRTQEITSVP